MSPIRSSASSAESATGSAAQDTPSPSPRLTSLDALRGLAVAGMILVNHPGDPNQVLGWLGHSDWHGLSPADLVFPLFVFVVGASASISLGGWRDRPIGSAARPWRKVLERTVRLLVLGLGLNLVLALPYFHPLETRIPGVLQRIALCYLASAAVVLTCTRSSQLVIAGVALAVYGCALRFVDVPGYGAGYLDDPEGTLPAVIDRWLFGERLWKGTWDPEGLLSTVPAIASALLGAVTADVLVRARDSRTGIAVLGSGGVVTLLAGALLATVQPINKNLWTPAFALVCAGLSLLALLVLVMVVDVKGHERLVRPLVYLGANPLAAYVGSEVAGQLLAILPHAEPERSARAWLVRHLFGWTGSAQLESLGYALAMLALWIGIARSLHRHRIFLKV